MILPTDIPSRAQVELLLEHCGPASVSIYVPTDPASNGERERIEFGTLSAEAAARLREAGEGVRFIRPIEDELADLRADEDFWRHQARSLALFATPDRMVTFRLANRLRSHVDVSDRFYVKPLLRALTFPHVAFVLALAQGSVRLSFTRRSCAKSMSAMASEPPTDGRLPMSHTSRVPPPTARSTGSLWTSTPRCLARSTSRPVR